MCRKYALSFPNYILIKEGILRENIRLGSVSKPYVFKMFKIESAIVDKIFDYLVKEEEIIEEEV